MDETAVDSVGDELTDDESFDEDLTGDLEPTDTDPEPSRPWGILLAIGSLIGFVASMILTIDRITIAGNPDANLACNISPFVTCGPAMLSQAGAIFGFPNPLLGIAGFAIAGTLGVLIASGTHLPRWTRIGLQLGVIGAAVLITFLQWTSFYVINALCIWCMTVWAVTIPIVVVTTVENLRDGVFGERSRRVGERLHDWQPVLIIAWYVLVIAVLALRFYAQFARYWFGVSI